MSPERINEILARIPSLPDTAVVPVAVAAAHDHVSTLSSNDPDLTSVFCEFILCETGESSGDGHDATS
jgi:hypothetical protein